MQRRRLRVTGTVQGVGFRPFVASLARRLSVAGAIGNDEHGVWCEAQAPHAVIRQFCHALKAEAPPLARVTGIQSEAIDVISGQSGFTIKVSQPAGKTNTISIPPDVAPCSACRAEIDDPHDRRYHYPFTCCTNCGPRYTVVRSMPYDRERTSLDDFPLCDECQAEYESPDNRRYHAQATCCPACGPTLALLPVSPPEAAGWSPHGDPIKGASQMLDNGSIVALKGVGGYQLLCRADREPAVTRLRLAKQRDQKPFAILVADIEQARQLVVLDEAQSQTLTAPEAPIVLVPRTGVGPIAASVAPDTELLGVMLPAAPIHQLLSTACGVPLVCTSGNHADDPIIIDDGEALERLGDIADAFLVHDRAIARRADDSVGRITNGRLQLLRRARGFAPRPVRLASDGPPVLAVGAELKNTVCLAVGREAHLSVHLGDLEHVATLEAFEHTIGDLLDLTGTTPALVVHDAHPEYLSSKFATAQDLAPTLAVQHHHAHLVACLVDNAHPGLAIGVTFDGAGWGRDGTLWGGDFLIGDASGFRRAAHLRPVPVPGGTAAVRQPWRMLIAHLSTGIDGASGVENAQKLPVLARHAADLDTVAALCESERSIMTSSMGRLFDAVSALCDLADISHYEGQAAILLEQAATRTSTEPDERYHWNVTGHDPLVIDPTPLMQATVDDRLRGLDAGVIAAKFHHSVAWLIVDVCRRLRARTGLETAVLSGGVFQNQRLVELAVPMLINQGFEVLRHAQVPPNDGGIALGQVAIGRAHLVGAHQS